jgi:hypothetical protein
MSVCLLRLSVASVCLLRLSVCVLCSEAVRVLKACGVAVQVAADVGLGRWVKLLNARSAAHTRVKQYELKQILDLSEQVRPDSSTWCYHHYHTCTTRFPVLCTHVLSGTRSM